MLVGVSVGCLMGCFRAPPPWRKTAPLKRPIKRSMIFVTCAVSTRYVFCQEKASAEIRGEFFPNKVPGEFCRGFFGGFFLGLFPWKK